MDSHAQLPSLSTAQVVKAIKPTGSPDVAPSTGEELYKQGLAFMKEKNWEEAASAFKNSAEASQQMINQLVEALNKQDETQKKKMFDTVFKHYTARFMARAAFEKARCQDYLQKQTKPVVATVKIEEEKPLEPSSTAAPSLAIFPYKEPQPLIRLTIPSEFEPQEALRLTWPKIDPMIGVSNISQFVKMVGAVAPYQYVDVRVNDTAQRQEAIWNFQKANISLNHIRLRIGHAGDWWDQDRGDTMGYLKNGTRAAIESQGRAWGMASVSEGFEKYAEGEHAVLPQIAKEYTLKLFQSSMVIEGGAMQFNGDGVLFTTKSVILQHERNPGLSEMPESEALALAEAELKRIFDIEKVFFLDEGIPADDSSFRGPQKDGDKVFYTPLTTNGHIDNVARVVSHDTILLAKVTEAEAKAAGPGSLAEKTRERLEAVYKVLSKATTREGKPFKIIRTPAPDEIFMHIGPGYDTFEALLEMKRGKEKGQKDLPLDEREPVISGAAREEGVDVAAAISYQNFVITNKVVLIPKYWQPGFPESMRAKDEQFKKIIQDVFPDHHILQVEDTVFIGFGGGGMHCISKYIPPAVRYKGTLFGSPKVAEVPAAMSKEASLGVSPAPSAV